jgi:hypothetical protein
LFVSRSLANKGSIRHNTKVLEISVSMSALMVETENIFETMDFNTLTQLMAGEDFGASEFPVHHNVRIGSEAHPDSNARGTGGSFLGSLATGTQM